MKLLIVYGTTEGQTRKICEFLRVKAKERGHTVSMNDSTGAVLSPFGFDGVIIASSIHNDRFQASVEHYLKEQSKLLNNQISLLLTVSLAAAGEFHESWLELKQATNDLLENSGWHPDFVEHVAGAIRYSKYNFLKKYAVRSLARINVGTLIDEEDHEYTDWEQVCEILDRLELIYKANRKEELLQV